VPAARTECSSIVGLLGCLGGAARVQSTDSCVASHIFGLPSRRISWRDGDAWSQVGEADRPNLAQLADSALRRSWLYAIPVPICSALGGTLVGKWFSKYDESAAVAANFFVSACVLVRVRSSISGKSFR
jgi:hypothetical protein